MKFERHIAIEDSAEPGCKVVEVLAAETHLPKPLIKQTMTKGAVWIESKQGIRRVRRGGRRVQAGERLHFYYDEHVLNQQVTPPELIEDEGEYSLWFKPAGMLCQGSKWGDHCTIHRWVEMHHQPQRPAFIVHRLDRAASGLILLAHKKTTAAYFADLFQDRSVEKRYQAVVSGVFPAERAFDAPVGDKAAHTRATLIATDSQLGVSLLNVRIDTGRKHQIRQHLSEAGFPILGDRLYGEQLTFEEMGDSLQLRSVFLSFTCPKSQEKRAFELPSSLQLAL